jgi:hypothetical protein
MVCLRASTRAEGPALGFRPVCLCVVHESIMMQNPSRRIRYRTAPPDPEGRDDEHLDRALFLDSTLDGAGVIRGDLTPQCAAMVQAVLDALSAPGGGGDLRTRARRYHDALAEAMRRLEKCIVVVASVISRLVDREAWGREREAARLRCMP